MFTKRNISIALAVSFIVMFVCGNSLAANSKPNPPKKGDVEVSAGAAGLLPIFPTVAVGWYLNNNFEFEAKAIFDPWACADAYILGNISYNWSIGRYIPYVTGGFGVCAHGHPLWAAGGGLKIRLSDKFCLRLEFVWGGFFGEVD